MPLGRSQVELVALSAGHGLTHWYTAAFFLVLPFISQDFGLTFTQAGLLVAYRTLLSAIANVPSAAISDWLGKRRLLMVFSIIWSVAVYLLIGWAPSYFLLQLFVALVGIGAILWHAPAMVTLSERFPKRKGFALSIHEFGANFGDAIAPIGVGLLLVVMDWRDALRVQVIPGLLLAALVWLVVADPTRKPGASASSGLREYGRSVRDAVSNPIVLLLAVISSLRTMSQNIVNTFLPIYLVVGLGFAAHVAGGYIAALTIPSLFSGLLLGTLSDRFGRRGLMVGGLVSSAGLLVAVGLAGSGAFFVAALIGVGFLLFSIRPVIMANAMDAVPAAVGGTTVAFLFLTNSLFSAVAPLAAGIVADSVGLVSTFYLSASLLLLAAAAAWLLPFVTSRTQAAAALANR